MSKNGMYINYYVIYSYINITTNDSTVNKYNQLNYINSCIFFFYVEKIGYFINELI